MKVFNKLDVLSVMYCTSGAQHHRGVPAADDGLRERDGEGVRGVEPGAAALPAAAAQGPADRADHQRRGQGRRRRRGQALRAHHGDVLGAAAAGGRRR